MLSGWVNERWVVSTAWKLGGFGGGPVFNFFLLSIGFFFVTDDEGKEVKGEVREEP